ncbi:aromatic amino acid lyase [Panacibacter sp. DH6]|uniref:Aromatic amino acid lyase n=1 Tax=Panacibacter microcysteis TaxID=2793269 RepID=A0A931GXV2_9BACT|nr:aromatic amino acid ammonia-lyase [Panacibacter microcysteis]MBG9376679.1 aromatic amino acid lyase [Panacibacter microcysteis]
MIAVGGKTLSLEDFASIVYKDSGVQLQAQALENVDRNYAFLKQFSTEKVIYGINTGFGPMAQYRVGEDKALQLQYNLIRSHSSGSGKLMPALLAKAVMVARLNTLMQGYSGVHTEVVDLLAELINKNVVACIYEHGGVGASGDLVQLAHLGLTLIGEGEVIYEDKVQPAAEVFAKLGIQPLSIHIREGLAILNGTSAMTGIGMLNIIQSRKLLDWLIILSSITNEVVCAFSDHFSYELNIVKHHKGQNWVASAMRTVLKDSKMIRNRNEHLYEADHVKQQEIFEDKVQEYYSLRCVTQVLGPVYDTIAHAQKIVTDELNSVNDNPVVDHHNQNIFHGGNFHGDYVALEMDKLRTAITKLSMLSERQLNYLLNDKLNKKFPPFLNLGVLGFNFGMQGVQFTAVSTVAENQSLSFPVYVHSIPNNNDNQDIVSMGCNAALFTKRVIDNTFEVLAIQMMTVLQAVDFLACDELMSSKTKAVYKAIRAIFPKFVEDTPKYKDVARVKQYLEQQDPLAFINDFVNVESATGTAR